MSGLDVEITPISEICGFEISAEHILQNFPTPDLEVVRNVEGLVAVRAQRMDLARKDSHDLLQACPGPAILFCPVSYTGWTRTWTVLHVLFG